MNLHPDKLFNLGLMGYIYVIRPDFTAKHCCIIVNHTTIMHAFVQAN